MAQLPEELLSVTYNMVPMYLQGGFNDAFDERLAQFTVGEQYQIKNELVRITEPYAKVIDLRDKVTQKCRKFIHKGRIHYLDETAIEVFNAGLELFGQYTLGIWEDVNNTSNNYRVLQAKAEQQRQNQLKSEQNRKAEKLQQILATKLSYSKDNYPLHVIQFGDYFNREEERMNYSVQATLTFADGREMAAVTKDFSVKGLYLRVGLSETVELDDIATVLMQDQDSKYINVAGTGIEYQVKRIEYIDKVIWLGLTRTFSEASGETSDKFAVYAKELILSNKYVYKVNLDNAIDAALKQGYEQVFFSRTVSIPLFVETLGNQFRVRYVMTTGLNNPNYHFWSDEDNDNYLASLFSSPRLRELINATDDETTLYCFSHQIGQQMLFFAAFASQLRDNPDLKQLFVGYGATKDSWKVFRIKRVTIDKANTGSLFVVPDRSVASQEKDQQEAQAVETVVEQEKPADVGNLTHALVMTEISDPLSRELFKKRGYDTALMAEITQFQIHLNDSGLPLKRVNFGLDELRHEPRFSYKTKVFVKFANGIRLESTSVDFSARGLRILLPNAVETRPLEVVQLAFPLLQQITKKLDLNHLDYRIVGTRNDQKTLYLRAVTIEGIVHHGVKFFYDLIKRNRNKLTLVADSKEDTILVKTLKNLYQQALGVIPFYLTRVDGQLRITQWVKSTNPHAIFDWLKADNIMAKVNVSSLIANNTFDHFIVGANNRFKTVNQSESMDLFIAYVEGEGEGESEGTDSQQDDEANQPQLVVKSNVELNTIERQKAFVDEALAAGEFICLRVYLSMVAKVDTHKIAEELAYIHHYARHKSKTIAQLLTRINNVGEMVDITEYVTGYVSLNN